MVPRLRRRGAPSCLNESPYEKVGKLCARSARAPTRQGLNESPYEKVGKYANEILNEDKLELSLNESPYEKVGKCRVWRASMHACGMPQ